MMYASVLIHKFIYKIRTLAAGLQSPARRRSRRSEPETTLSGSRSFQKFVHKFLKKYTGPLRIKIFLREQFDLRTTLLTGWIILCLVLCYYQMLRDRLITRTIHSFFTAGYLE